MKKEDKTMQEFEDRLFDTTDKFATYSVKKFQKMNSKDKTNEVAEIENELFDIAKKFVYFNQDVIKKLDINELIINYLMNLTVQEMNIRVTAQELENNKRLHEEYQETVRQTAQALLEE